MTKKRKRRDAIQEWVEYQDHVFVRGYWAGRVPPILLGKRPNKVGYLILAAGTLTVLVVMLRILESVVVGGPLQLDSSNMVEIGCLAALSVLMIASGVALLRGPRRGKRSGR
jgi:hypothetical protein